MAVDQGNNGATAAANEEDLLECPVCTFLNQPFSSRCEICESAF